MLGPNCLGCSVGVDGHRLTSRKLLQHISELSCIVPLSHLPSTHPKFGRERRLSSNPPMF